MNRAIIVVPERRAGWDSGAILPLLEEAEWGTHAALTAAGFLVDVVGERAFLSGAETTEALVILASPGAELRTGVEKRLADAGGGLLIANDRSRGATPRSAWRTRAVRGIAGRFRLDLARTPRHARRGLRQLVSGAREFTLLEPEAGEEVVARWGGDGPPALSVRRSGALTTWRSGFPLDHLDLPGLEHLLESLGVGTAHGVPRRDAIPERGRAVVLLLHDVEDPVAGDKGGVGTVISGLEACLDAEKRHGFSATYNLVGAFARSIPGWVRRMVEEGHEIASHGATHQVMGDLDPERLRREVIEAEESVEQICGVRIRGFRSPRSRWSIPLLECLAARDYQWNAEGDPSPFPYYVPRNGAGGLLRIPVAVDDWDFVKEGSSPRQMLARWMKEVRWAIERRCWVGVGSHPSVLGVRRERMTMFSDFLSWLASESVAVMTHAEAAGWWRSRMKGAGESVRESGERWAQKGR